jgi:hypothetical protein
MRQKPRQNKPFHNPPEPLKAAFIYSKTNVIKHTYNSH